MSGAAPRVRVFPTTAALAQEAVRSLTSWAQQAVGDHGRFALALSGGKTPATLYELLAAAGPGALPYDRIEVFWSDERAVPPDHRESNYGLAWSAWLSRVPLEARRLHRIRGEGDPETVAADYEIELRHTLGDPPHLDLVLLGVGRDGHTASLFPHDPALRADRLVVAVSAPVSPRRRVTFTLRLINAARHGLVLVTGRHKAAAVRRALEGPPSPASPASWLRGPHVVWLLDKTAAAGLRGRSIAARGAEGKRAVSD